jgi:ceramide glucosyltransferase
MKSLAWFACLIGLLLASGLIAIEGPLHGEHLILMALAYLCGVGAVFGIAYTVLAGALIGRFFARTTAEPTSFPPVTVVKPLHGHEWTLLSNLSSFCQKDYPGL